MFGMLRITFLSLGLLNLVSALQIPGDGIYGDANRQNDVLGGVRQGRETITPNHDYFQRLIIEDRSKKSIDEIDRSGFPGFHQKKHIPYSLDGFVKKNFDEIDASGFRGFVKKNFDEIDRSSFNDFGKRNFDEIDASGFRGFDKKNLYGSFDLDRRDLEKYQRLHFPDYLKISRMRPRSYLTSNLDDIGSIPSRMQKKNFDEIDRSGFPGFNKRF